LLSNTNVISLSTGNCSLKIDIPGGRCKSCLLQACLQKYIIDPKKHPKIFQKKETHCVGEKAVNPQVIPNTSFNTQIKVKQQQMHSQVQAQAQSAKPQTILPKQQQVHHAIKTEIDLPSTPSNGVVSKSGSSSGLKRKQDMSEAGMLMIKTRRGGCRECIGCKAEDCGECLYCLDKPKFGGNDVKKQRCVKRRCHNVN
jgi:hypothetical protein